MWLTNSQIEKLADLFIDIAKGMFLAGLLVPAVSSAATIAESFRSILGGLFFTYLSVKILELKEDK